MINCPNFRKSFDLSLYFNRQQRSKTEFTSHAKPWETSIHKLHCLPNYLFWICPHFPWKQSLGYWPKYCLLSFLQRVCTCQGKQNGKDFISGDIFHLTLHISANSPVRILSEEINSGTTPPKRQRGENRHLSNYWRKFLSSELQTFRHQHARAQFLWMPALLRSRTVWVFIYCLDEERLQLCYKLVPGERRISAPHLTHYYGYW